MNVLVRDGRPIALPMRFLCSRTLSQNENAEMNTPTRILSALLVTALSACKPHDHLTDHGQKQASVESPATDKKMTEAEHAAMPAMAAGAKMASATGTVESVDIAAGKITLAHGPVDALGWPAMTMGFKATPEQIASVRPGQSVRFEFMAEDRAATITRIEPAH